MAQKTEVPLSTHCNSIGWVKGIPLNTLRGKEKKDDKLETIPFLTTHNPNRFDKISTNKCGYNTTKRNITRHSLLVLSRVNDNQKF